MARQSGAIMDESPERARSVQSNGALLRDSTTAGTGGSGASNGVRGSLATAKCEKAILPK
jgi:hypothetical protein